jgi:LAO/AO transport system kinase
MLLESVRAGDRLSLARLITGIENKNDDALAILEQLFVYTGKAHLIGVTGAPGTGKSSLVNQIARLYRHPAGNISPKRVGIVAVDPTSPFTGGALLGDRVRMRDLAGDAGVFIRSMASRGTLGGLAASTSRVVQAMDAAGFEVVIIETVGVGQSEIDVARLAHTVVVVEAPGLGDDIQAGKAGILEVADLLVVNKADQPGADNAQRALNQMLDMAFSKEMINHNYGPSSDARMEIAIYWRPPVVKTVATEGEGVENLFDAIQRHHDFLKNSGEWIKREKNRLRGELEQRLQDHLLSRWREHVPESSYDEMLAKLLERQILPCQAVMELLDYERSFILT